MLKIKKAEHAIFTAALIFTAILAILLRRPYPAITPIIVPINRGYAVLLDSNTALSAYHLKPFNPYMASGLIYENPERDIIVYSYASDVCYTVKDWSVSKSCDEVFILYPDLFVEPGDSGKPIFEGGHLVGIIVGSYEGRALISTVSDLRSLMQH